MGLRTVMTSGEKIKPKERAMKETIQRETERQTIELIATKKKERRPRNASGRWPRGTIAILFYSMAPAHLHVTGVAVYPAVFLSTRVQLKMFQVQIMYDIFIHLP